MGIWKWIRLIVLVFAPLLGLRAQGIEEQITKMEGRFAGEWQSFKRNLNGEIEMANSWQDTLTLSEHVIQDDWAFVKAHVRYVFDNPSLATSELEYKEGFFYEQDSVTEYFYISGGEVTRYTRLDEHTFGYTKVLHQNEYKALRFLNGFEGYHTIIKSIINQGGQEVHKISRLTTVLWLDENDQVQSTQFVSLKGTRKRIE